MTDKQKWVLTLTSPATVMVALDALAVSTVPSTIRPHDRAETRAFNAGGIDRTSEGTL
jgi:hypothetical protein